MNLAPAVAVLGALCAIMPAQLSVVIPAGTATSGGDTSNAFPWGWTASGYTGLRHQCIYDSANFTSQNVNGQILITRLRWRPDQGSSAVSGGVYQQADIRLSTCPVDYTAQTSNFGTNHGPDLTTVHSGPVTFLPTPGSAAWTTSSWCIDVTLTTPFLYDTALGDLVIDCEYLATSWQGGSVSSMDVQSSGSMAGRTWGSTAYPNANGTWLDHGLVVAVDYVPPAGYAYSMPYGHGCLDRASASFYELFGNNSFDLSNSTLRLVPTGSGYVAVPLPPQWTPPQTATPLPLGGDAVTAALNLGFILNYPGGTTNSVYVSSNGFVWAQSNTAHGCCNGHPAQLLAGAARWCPLWTDLDPTAGGGVHFHTDPANAAAYVSFVNVREAGAVASNTFQVAFFGDGTVEYRWQACAVGNHDTITGWSPGGNALDPGSIDLSASTVVLTEPDLIALTHTATARPVIGTTIGLVTHDVPGGALLGATLAGLTAFVPPIDLTPFGMPGCQQAHSAEAVLVWLPTAGTGTSNFTIPNNTAFAGIDLYTQGAALVPGINAPGAITSNGLRLVVDAQ